MPEITEEQIADVIDEHLPNFHGGLAAARALLALFAPILAEKQAHIDKLADLLIETQTKAMDAVAETEARALAAEAAVLAVSPYTDSIVCYASTIDTHDGNRVAKLVNEAAAAIRAQGE